MPQYIERVTAKDPLAESSYFFPYPTTKGVFLLESLWRSVGSSPRATHVRDGQKRADVAGRPIIGVGDVMEKVKVMILVKTSGGEVCQNLPKKIVNLMSSLDSEQGAKPPGQSDIGEMKIVIGFFLQGSFYANTILRVG